MTVTVSLPLPLGTTRLALASPTTGAAVTTGASVTTGAGVITGASV